MKNLKHKRRISFLIIVTIVLITIGMAFSCHKKEKAYSFETAPAKKGTIINTVTATGTIAADTTVSVGTQVSGVIKKIYVDFNSVVKKGQLMAELDKTPLQTAVQQAQASLDDAKSEVGFQTATFERYKALLDKKLVAQADFDQVKYNYDKAQANLKTAEAGYDKAKVNLAYASIYSPIVGVVLNRAVEQGQTVAASFNTPTLFTIGNDLTQMQVQANVDEADIGQLHNGQEVEFTVDAYPYETFRGKVRQLRLQPVVTNNVVTYTVIVNAPNPEKKLMPGMTANISVIVQKVDSVLTVPAKALRFTPEAGYLAEYMKKHGNQQGNMAGQQGSLAYGNTRGGVRRDDPPGAQGGGNASDGRAGTPAGNNNQSGGQGAGGGAQGSGAPGGNLSQRSGVTRGTGQQGNNFQGQGTGQQGGGQQGGGQQGAGRSTGGGREKKPVFVWIKNGEDIRRVRVESGAVDGTNAEIKSGVKMGDEVILSMASDAKSETDQASNTRSPFMPQRPGANRGR